MLVVTPCVALVVRWDWDAGALRRCSLRSSVLCDGCALSSRRVAGWVRSPLPLVRLPLACLPLARLHLACLPMCVLCARAGKRLEGSTAPQVSFSSFPFGSVCLERLILHFDLLVFAQDLLSDFIKERRLEVYFVKLRILLKLRFVDDCSHPRDFRGVCQSASYGCGARTAYCGCRFFSEYNSDLTGIFPRG